MILSGDIGGTNTRLAFFSETGGRLRMEQELTYPSREHSGLYEIVQLFLSQGSVKIDAACFGIAGPVLHGRATASNLPWIIDASELSRQLGTESVWLVNDLEAHAAAIDDLSPSDFVALNSAQSADGNAALIAAGTGLGEAGLYWDGTRRRAFPCEGGHTDFAPRNDLEVGLLKHLLQKYARVSYERVLSGPGLKNIYDFLRDSGTEPEPAWLKEELEHSPDPPALISAHGLQGRAAICTRVLDIFMDLYGAEAGNLALKMMATGGVYISGGIAGKILPKFKEPTFLRAFTAKGRMQPVLEGIPVRVVIDEKIGLIGTARCATLRRSTQPAVPTR
ncbi:MAG TPA: glucokinase [Candidatus Angelobacter sp.]|nr:glucokinase [Candidatus Angelobacter sp.]